STDSSYQMTLIPNWTSRALVTVDFISPAESFSEPSEPKISVWSGNTGGAKFARFVMLNISARNWMLNDSEIRRMWLFLNTAKSRLINPGAVMMFRPALPRRLKHCSGATGAPTAGGTGSQFAFQNARFGAVGIAKQSVLTYCLALPGFTSELHPEPPKR